MIGGDVFARENNGLHVGVVIIIVVVAGDAVPVADRSGGRRGINDPVGEKAKWVFDGSLER